MLAGEPVTFVRYVVPSYICICYSLYNMHWLIILLHLYAVCCLVQFVLAGCNVTYLCYFVAGTMSISYITYKYDML